MRNDSDFFWKLVSFPKNHFQGPKYLQQRVKVNIFNQFHAFFDCSPFPSCFLQNCGKYIIRVNRCAGAHKIRVWVSESPISWAQLSHSMGFVTHNYRATGVDCLCSHCNRSVLCVEWRASDGNIQLNNNLCRLR